MIIPCRTYLVERLAGLLLSDGTTRPYTMEPENIFFDELPRDFLKDRDYAVCCLALQDRTKKNGKLIGKTRIIGDQPSYRLQRRRFTREILFRCLLYGPVEELWPATGTGLIEQFTQAIAESRVISDTDNSAIRIEPQESVRPWDGGVEMDRKLRRPRIAIARILFSGGVQTTAIMPIIPSIEFVPIVGPVDKAVLRRDSVGMIMTDSTGEIMKDSAGWNETGLHAAVITDSAGEIRFDSAGNILSDSDEA